MAHVLQSAPDSFTGAAADTGAFIEPTQYIRVVDFFLKFARFGTHLPPASAPVATIPQRNPVSVRDAIFPPMVTPMVTPPGHAPWRTRRRAG
jgi:hypothetical protein